VNETEEQQIEAMKAWWKENGRSIIIGVIIGCSLILAWQWWNKWQTNQKQHASSLFQTLTSEVEKNQWPKAEQTAQKLIADYDNSPYASSAAMIMAKSAISRQQYDQARKHLKWIVKQKQHEGLDIIANLYLAKLMLAENQPQKAYEILKKNKFEGFESLQQELLGDTLIRLNKVSEARQAYQQALTSTTLPSQDVNLLQMKLENLMLTQPSMEKRDEQTQAHQ